MVDMCVNEFQIWYLIFMTIQQLTNSRLLFYWNNFRCMQEKKDFGRERRKNEIERKKQCKEMYVS